MVNTSSRLDGRDFTTGFTPPNEARDNANNPSYGPVVEEPEEDFGFTTVSPFEGQSHHQVDMRNAKIKAKIGPFLDNLAKNPSQDIHWPDRDKRIAQFKKELWDIIDS